VLRRRVLHIRRRVPLPELDAIGALDGILISHAHHDHLDPPSLRLVARDCLVIAPRGCAGILRRSGVRERIEVDAGDRIDVEGVEIEAVPAHHDGRRYPVGRLRPALGYLMHGPPTIYFAGDTDLHPELERLQGRVEVAALPVGGWGPRVPAGHLDPERAARAAAVIQPKIAIPIHWGTLVALGSQRGVDPAAPALDFSRAVERQAPQVDVRVLASGQRLEL
jgi:L-ascorbate metabolism protein UlaG (beta-lactamase superfamily)